ncbi:MAG TPA: hypothetical protein VNO22_13830 [Planctomycetota bacterium]|nr:hypothetical protein [Planctomycetota bacterium]
MQSLIWALLVAGPLLAPRALIHRQEPGVALSDDARPVEVRLEERNLPPYPWTAWRVGLAGTRRLCPPGALVN